MSDHPNDVRRVADEGDAQHVQGPGVVRASLGQAPRYDVANPFDVTVRDAVVVQRGVNTKLAWRDAVAVQHLAVPADRATRRGAGTDATTVQPAWNTATRESI